MVRIRDLPVAGCVTWPLGRERRFHRDACGRTFTETHPALPSRQRVSVRFRRRLFERCRGGAAHLEIARDERTFRYQVNRAFAGDEDELLARRESAPARRLSLDEAPLSCRSHSRSIPLPPARVVSDQIAPCDPGALAWVRFSCVAGGSV